MLFEQEPRRRPGPCPAAAIAFTREIFREVKVRPETFAAAMDLFGSRGTVEITALIGDYLMITRVCNALGMRLRADQRRPSPSSGSAGGSGVAIVSERIR